MGQHGKGVATGMLVTLSHLFRKPVTTQYPEQRLTISRRTRGNELIWQEDQCSGCSTCARSCPLGVIHIQTSGEGTVQSPCSQACPAHVDIPRYVKYISEGKPGEALAVIREKLPFPSVCGRVCFHPCEQKCQRAQIDQPVAIRILKRWAAEHDTGLWKSFLHKSPATGKRVAVIGSGPAGLTAAYYLARLGHSVMVLEALPEAGGMMRVGIPDYRLPKDVLQKEIDEIRAQGVEIKPNTRITDLDELLRSGCDAVFLALGAHQGMRLGVPGEDLPGVIDCATFLREIALGQKINTGSSVVVVGGGNAAIDAARVSLRSGANKVTMVYRRTAAEMPANPEEITAALEEGVKIEYLAAPTRVIKSDKELVLECIRMKLGEPDQSGRRRPEPVTGSEFTISADTIISAIGQRPDVPGDFKVAIEKGNTIKVDVKTLSTTREGVFAGGDVQTGPASVVAAIAAGRQGAISIDKYLGGQGEIDEILAPVPDKEHPLQETDKNRHRVHPAEIPAAERSQGFAEIEKSLTAGQAVNEAKRCLKCDLAYKVENISADMGYCTFCGLCIEACPRNALFLGYGYECSRYTRTELQMDKGGLTFTGEKQRSGYARPQVEENLPQQTLLINRDRRKP